MADDVANAISLHDVKIYSVSSFHCVAVLEMRRLAAERKETT
jgi:hypothetical protein